MKTITKYQADDGAEFTKQEDCRAYESVSSRVDEIMSIMPAPPEGTDFSNGSGYIQHNEAEFKQARRQILELANEINPFHWFDEALANENVHPSYPGRIISEMENGNLYKAWYRFMCIDVNLREWGQPYYRDNPEQAKQVCLNPSQVTQ